MAQAIQNPCLSPAYSTTTYVSANTIRDGQRLTDSLLLRSLCTANIDFIGHALAARTRMGVAYVHSRLTGGGAGDIDALWTKAGFAASLLPLVKMALTVLADTQREGAKWDVDFLRSRIAQRLVTGPDEMTGGLSAEDAEYVLGVAGDGPREARDLVGDSAADAPKKMKGRAACAPSRPSWVS